MGIEVLQTQDLFFRQLKDIFIGAKIEGQSGFINLMKIKSSYFDSIFKELVKEIEDRTEDFPEFREELFDKLYSFFKTYFSESGSIYFRYTPLKSKVFEKVYSNQKDVALFWKTHMLYYAKSDRLWNSLTIDFDKDETGYKINFDVSELKDKDGNEKKEIIYELKGVKVKEVTFRVLYSEKGKTTKMEDILSTLKKDKVFLDELRLSEVLRIFEKQNEVDFFINKDAETFLKEQFDLWLKNYLFDDESDFNERRLKQLKSLKAIAYRVIDFVSQFEDELVKVWNKPKFVLNSNYIISLDRIGRKNIGLIDAIINHKQFFKQEREWKELGLLEQFDRRKLYTNTLDGKKLSEEYQHLPIDTKNFDEDVKLEVLSLFENLDEELEGWLIHSDNYQALKTILPKFQNRIQTIYIDPPYNTDASSIIYQNNYKDSSWLSLMENRLQLAHSLLKDDGMICVAIDDEEFPQLKLLLQDIFEKTCGVAVVRSNPAGRKTKGKFAPAHEYALFYGKSEKSVPASLEKTEKSLARYPRKDERGRFEWANFIRSGSEDRREDRRTLYYPIFVSKDNKIRIPKFHWDDSKQEYILEEEPHHDETPVYPVVKKNGKTIEKRWQRGYDRVINEPEEFRVKRKATGEIAIEFKTRIDMDSLPITWWDDNRYASANYGAAESKELFGEKRFDFAKSTKLVQDCLRASNLGAKSRDFVLDFFSGSGSTAQAIMMLNAEDGGNRKFLLVEMAEYFYTVLVPRLKKLCYALSWNNGRPCKLDGLGIFCKYYDLEQYEMALRRSIYKESHPFSVLSDKTIYQQYIFLKDLKMLNSMVVDKKNNKIRIDFTKIYPNIDLAETLSNLLGKPIKKIEKNAVELEGSKRIEFEDIDFSMVKPLIWW